MVLTNFEKLVFNKLNQIPRGRVVTYKALAIAIGRRKSFRAVGNALNKNNKLIEIPCHRVVRADGSVGGYRLGSVKKRKLLSTEGIKFIGNKVILEEHLYKLK
jgi:methylated-DNA-[protein]-cysteine S-methyltransferase